MRLDWFDASNILTGTVSSHTETYHCIECGEDRTRTVIDSHDDYQSEGLSLNIMDVNSNAIQRLYLRWHGDADYIVVEQSDDVNFCEIGKVKAMLKNAVSPSFRVSHRYIRLRIVGGVKTLAEITKG